MRRATIRGLAKKARPSTKMARKAGMVGRPMKVTSGGTRYGDKMLTGKEVVSSGRRRIYGGAAIGGGSVIAMSQNRRSSGSGRV